MSFDSWHDAHEVSLALVDDGWMSPNSYSNHWDEPGNFSAVYLFQVHDRETLRKSLVAYVGQSIYIKMRLSGHEVLRALNHPDVWVKRWFKRTSRERLDETELRYIQQFDPPWNIQGKRRGVSFGG